MCSFMHLRPEGQDFSEKILRVTNGRPVKFKGISIASCETSDNNARSDYSGSPGRWREYIVYLTSGGNLVLFRDDCTRWQGENNRRYATLFRSTEELIKFVDDMEHCGKAERYLIDEIEALGIDLSKDLDE
jgi:hypothetical protein